MNIGKNEQFNLSFLAISPNNRMPAIVDNAPLDKSSPLSVFESGAILWYLADIAIYPWIVPHEKKGQDLTQFKNIKKWFDRMHDRPAVAKAYSLNVT